MAKRYYTLPIKEATFPMLSSEQHRTLIQNSEGSGTGIENPGILYCHNLMPAAEGVDSIGFLQVIPPYSPVTNKFVDTRIIYGSARSRISIAFDSAGGVYIVKTGYSFWNKVALTAPTNPEEITFGTVNGVSYIFFSKQGCHFFDESTNQFVAVTLTGLSIPNTLGISSSYGYLIAYTANAIAWSSTIDPTDFTPSLTTGAGGGDVAGIGGEIKFILANSLGILVYSYTNVISGTYTGNVKYPFKYREVDGSKGGLSLDATAYEANSTAQYVYTKAGMQALTSQKAENILPEVTNFLAGKVYEDFDEATKKFIHYTFTSTMKKKVKFIASRYLIISYGVTEFTHALVYDTSIKRLGKIKLTHVDCFEYIADQAEVSRESIAFLLASGEVRVLDFTSSTEALGVVIFGKLQYTRSRLMTLQGVEIENVGINDTAAVSTLVSQDGKNFTAVDGVELTKVDNLRKYGFRSTGINHSILVTGKFSLATLFIIYTLAGRR